MAITNVELKAAFGGAPGQPTFTDIVEIDLDSSYPEATGGYAGIAAILQAVIGADKTIISMEQQNYPAPFFCSYDRANDKLQVYTEALVEVANAVDLAAMANVEFLVTTK